MSYVLILGASSDIANAVAHRYAKAGYNLFLAGRNVQDLSLSAVDIHIRYQVDVEAVEFDALAFSSHKNFYSSLKEKPLGVICAFGYLGNQENAEYDFDETYKILDTNFIGCVSILNIIANDFSIRNFGFIVGISSVAGERGRKKNYMYGSAKAGFTAYLSGVRNRLFIKGVQVLTVNPGFVYTKMTEGLELPAKLTAHPKEVAEDIFAAQQQGKDVLFTKWFWKWIMLIIKLIPEKIFKKLSV